MNKKLREAMENIAQSTRTHTGKCSPADVYEICVVIKGILEHLGIEDEEPADADNGETDASGPSEEIDNGD